MIIDKIENASLYFAISDRIKIAFDYLQNTDFLNIKLGKHEILGDDVYAMVFEYETKEVDVNKLEAHKKYIDIQYIVKGEEKVGVSVLYEQGLFEKYNQEDDYHLFIDNEMSQVVLKKGLFAIFFPDDLHLPGLKNINKQQVKKVVLKVKI